MKETLQDKLEAEFCPPLDSTLVAVLVADYMANEPEEESDKLLRKLRDSLSELAAGAVAVEDDWMHGGFSDADMQRSCTTEDSGSIFDGLGDASSASDNSSVPSAFHGPLDPSLRSAMDFLQASFPQVSTSRLQERLQAVQVRADDNGLDMEGVVEDLLNDEYMREMEERGMDIGSQDRSDQDAGVWELVERQPRAKGNRDVKAHDRKAGPSKKKKLKGKTVLLADVRQSQLTQRVATPSSSHPAPDLWTQLSSLSEYLSSLMPSQPSNFFLSYFHAPEHQVPSEAIRAALSDIAKKRNVDPESPQLIPSLFGLLDVICSNPSYGELDSMARDRLHADAQVALAATNGSSDVSLDVVTLLRELDVDGDTVMLMGVYHSPASIPLPASPVVSSSISLSTSSSLLEATSSSLPPSPKPLHIVLPTASKPKFDNDWQIVKPRTPRVPAVHPLAAHIPAYNPNNVPRKSSRNTFSRGEKDYGVGLGINGVRDVGGRIGEFRRLRDEALRDASRYWQRGNVKSRGGEVAFYFAERARNLQEQSKQLQLDAARRLVQSKRIDSEYGVTIDVHYTTTSEAIVIAREVLEEGTVSSSYPLRIITGRGSHSSTGVSVLGPAIKRALDADGWIVGKVEGGLVVRGRESHRRH